MRVIIEIRNKLAHGQWAYPLTNDGDDFSTALRAAMESENLLSLQYKRKLISCILDIVHDVAVSPPTFERDFDSHYRQIVNVRRNLVTRHYSDYVSSLVSKKQRGLKKRP
ncbi:MAG: hypothetical protein ABIR33_04795 [Pyrinomonadaceae bacterium]